MSEQSTIERKAEGSYRLEDASRGRFAEVFLRIEPTTAGTGIEVADGVFGSYSMGASRAFERGIREALCERSGRWGRFTDVRVTVLDVKHDPVDCTEAEFEEAAKQALHDALDRAGSVSVNRKGTANSGSGDARAATTFAGARKLSPIFNAAGSGDYEATNRLLSSSPDLTELNDRGETALLVAAANGQPDIVQLLHDAGAALDARNSKGLSAWDYAIENRDHRLAAVLAERGFQPPESRRPSVETLLMKARATRYAAGTSRGPRAVADEPGLSTDGDPSINAATPSTECTALLELATPQLYRRNPFRVLGVPVNARPKDVQRQQNRRKMQEKLGIASSGGYGGPLALEPPPTDGDIRAAMERLNRPIDRLLDEVFWFWPNNGNVADDPALQALEQGQVKKAAELWMEQAKRAVHREIATHNLAVLDHLVALDYEARLASQGLEKKEQERLADLWLRGFARWKQVLEGEEFWSVVKNRVRDLDDVQLTTGFVRRIRSALPAALLLINAKIAYSAAERSDSEFAGRHIQLLQVAEFGCGLADEAIRESLKPMRNRIKTATDNARSRWTRTPHHANRFARELHEQAKSMLAIVDTILPADDLTLVGLHDLVAETIRQGLVGFATKTNDWKECDRVLQLAEEVAIGESVRAKLSNDREILQQNAKDGSDWCSPGYWDLPEEAIAKLEDARAKTQAGDYEGAIPALSGLDPKIGKPLRRCLAFCLSRHGSQIAGEALNEFDSKPTNKVQTFLDVIGSRDSVPVPNSDMSSWQVPDCPCCGKNSYTSWVNGEYSGQRFWMCSSCSEEDNREREERMGVLRTKISQSLEYLLLSDELDSSDTSVREYLSFLKKTAKDINASIPKTKELKKKLGDKKTRGIRHEFESSPEDTVCHFCGESAADKSGEITVPMCGERHPVDLLFCKGIEYRYGDVVVPRCRRCRDEHHELLGRIEKWNEGRLAAASEEHFPEMLAAVSSTERAAILARDRINTENRAVAEARVRLEQAEAIGTRCNRCNSDASWQGYLCGRCDKKVFRLGSLSVGLIAALMLSSVYAVQMLNRDPGIWSPLAELIVNNTTWDAWEVRWVVPLIANGAIPISVALGCVALLKQLQWRRRRQLRNERGKLIPQRRDAAVADARPKLGQAMRALASVEETAQVGLKAREDAHRKLRAAEDEAVAEFERLYPEPSLSVGVKSEDTYLEFCRIRDFKEKRGWGFGREPQGNGASLGESPVNVQGLVARAPRPVTERFVVSCPKCHQRQRVPRTGDLLEVKCPCGQRFECRDGERHEGSAGTRVERLPVVIGYRCPSCGSFSSWCKHRVTDGLVVDCRECGQRFVNSAV